MGKEYEQHVKTAAIIAQKKYKCMKSRQNKNEENVALISGLF
jgi:hypothetical protein